MRISKEKLEELKQIHYKHTGEMLSDIEVLEMGIRLTNLFKVIGKKIPENNQESGEEK